MFVCKFSFNIILFVRNIHDQSSFFFSFFFFSFLNFKNFENHTSTLFHFFSLLLVDFCFNITEYKGNGASYRLKVGLEILQSAWLLLTRKSKLCKKTVNDVVLSRRGYVFMMTYVLIVTYVYEKHQCIKNHQYFVRMIGVSIILSLQNQ